MALVVLGWIYVYEAYDGIDVIRVGYFGAFVLGAFWWDD